MLKEPKIDIKSNAQCQCFEKIPPQQKLFLSKKPSLNQNIKNQSFNDLPDKVQLALRQASVKKSLKRYNKSKIDILNVESPVRQPKDIEIRSQRNLTLRDARSEDGRSINELNTSGYQIQRINSSNLLKIEPKVILKPTASQQIKNHHPTPLSFTYKPYNIRNTYKQQTVKSPRINFTIVNPSKHEENLTKNKEKEEQKKRQKSRSGLKKKHSLKQELKEKKTGKLMRKQSNFTSSFPQQIDWQTLKSLQQTQRNIKEAKKKQFKKDSNIIFKSLPNIDSPTLKKKKTNKAVLNKMSQVQQIRSLADSGFESEESEQSVVLDSLQKQNTDKKFQIPKLDKQIQDNQSVTTIISTQNSKKKPQKVHWRQFIN